MGIEVSQSPFDTSIGKDTYLVPFEYVNMAAPEFASKPEDSQISHTDALTYWNAVPATANAMLGDMLRKYPQISRIDVRGTLDFFAKVRRSNISSKRELVERGCRLRCRHQTSHTAGSPSQVCRVIDAVEPVEMFAKLAPKMILT